MSNPAEGVRLGSPEPIGVVLAGGLGRRIGGAKAIVHLRGRPLISYPVGAMRAALGEAVVLAKADTQLPSLPGVTVWIESGATYHPLVGIIEALGLAAGRPVLICAGDLPFVTPELIRRVAAADPGAAPALVASVRGAIQPLLGQYEPGAAPLLRDALSDGEPPLRAAVQAISPALLEVEDPDLLFDVNAPEDLLRAAAMVDAGARVYPNVKS